MYVSGESALPPFAKCFKVGGKQLSAFFSQGKQQRAEDRNVAVEAAGLVKNCFRAPCNEH